MKRDYRGLCRFIGTLVFTVWECLTGQILYQSLSNPHQTTHWLQTLLMLSVQRQSFSWWGRRKLLVCWCLSSKYLSYFDPCVCMWQDVCLCVVGQLVVVKSLQKSHTCSYIHKCAPHMHTHTHRYPTVCRRKPLRGTWTVWADKQPLAWLEVAMAMGR